MEEIVTLVKTQGLGFDALIEKFTAAGIAKARELAAMVLLMAQGKIPTDAVNAPVSAADLETIGATGWVAELKVAGQDTVTVEAVPDADVQKAVAAIKTKAAANPPETKPPATAATIPPPPAGSPTSKTVEKTETVTVEFTASGADKPEMVTLSRTEVGTQLSELHRLRAEALKNKIDALGVKNDKGYALPPAVVEMTRALLTRKSDSAILLAKDVTVPDVNGAVLRILSEVRDRGLVLLTEQTNVESQQGLKGKKLEFLGYGPDSVPADVMLTYKRRIGEGVTERDVCIAELMLRYINGDKKMDPKAAKRQAEADFAALEA